MDYKEILKLAEKKQQTNEKEKIEFNKRLAHARKERGPDRSAIAAFKARREKEELQKKIKARLEFERLQSLRAQSGKASKRSKMMKNRTKDNDFSKLVMTRDTMDEQERIQEMMRRKEVVEKRDDKVKKDVYGSGKDKKTTNSSKNEVNTKPVVKKKPPPPSLNYQDLLKLAEEKSNHKVDLEKEIIEDMKTKKQERPMTQAEKDRLKEERYYKAKADKGLVRLPTEEERRRNDRLAEEKREKLAKLARLHSDASLANEYSKSNIDKFVRDKSSSKNLEGIGRSSASGQSNGTSNYQPQVSSENRKATVTSTTIYTKQSSRDSEMNQDRNERFPTRPSSSYAQASSSNSRPDRNRPIPDKRIDRDRPNLVRSNPYRHNDYEERNERRSVASKEPKSLSQMKKIKSETPPPSPPRQRNLPPIGISYRRGMYEDVAQYVDPDDEYDDEYDDEDDMDDFIDDEPIEEDYSKHIREIFGYDKRKYKQIDDDDDDMMESSYAQCMKEEIRSAKIGLQEDLEDIRMEEEEKKRKRMMAKQRQRR